MIHQRTRKKRRHVYYTWEWSWFFLSWSGRGHISEESRKGTTRKRVWNYAIWKKSAVFFCHVPFRRLLCVRKWAENLRMQKLLFILGVCNIYRVFLASAQEISYISAKKLARIRPRREPDFSYRLYMTRKIKVNFWYWVCCPARPTTFDTHIHEIV